MSELFFSLRSFGNKNAIALLFLSYHSTVRNIAYRKYVIGNVPDMSAQCCTILK